MMLAFAMMMGFCMSVPVMAAEQTDLARPTSTTKWDAAEVEDMLGTVKVTAGGETQTASVYEDDNTSDMLFLRTVMPAAISVDALKNASVEVTFADAVESFDFDGLSFSGSDRTWTCSSLDLFNKSYTINVDGIDYVLAVGIAGGKSEIPSSETGIISDVKVTASKTTVNGDLSRFIVQNDYMGNPYYGDQAWTNVNYYITSNLSAVDKPSQVTVSYNGTESATVTLGSTVPTLVVGGQTYYLQLTFKGTVTVYYHINMSELESYSGVTPAVTKEINEIYAAWNKHFGNSGEIQVDSGTTVLAVMEGFLESEFPGKYTLNNGYLSAINGIDVTTGGSAAGWMYTDEDYSPICKVPSVGAGQYVLNTDGQTITWFYTTNFNNHF